MVEESSRSEATRSVFRVDLFEGKVALVTGGGTGIGYAISTELASIGCLVVIASRDETKCIRAAKEINQALARNSSYSSSGNVYAGPSTSLRVEEEIDCLIGHVIEKYGRLDFLINNAGGQFVSAGEDISRNGFNAVVETNLTGTFMMCKHAYQQWMRDHGGSIVNITLGNRNGMPMMVHSGAARAGIENMTATLCNEWIESGVRINCVRPGIIWTESGFKNYGALGDVFAKKLLPSIPARRFGSPEEISSAVCWLLSDGAAYVTGAVLCVDGGSSYHFLPLIDIEDSSHLPIYGTLPTKGKL